MAKKVTAEIPGLEDVAPQPFYPSDDHITTQIPLEPVISISKSLEIFHLQPSGGFRSHAGIEKINSNRPIRN